MKYKEFKKNILEITNNEKFGTYDNYNFYSIFFIKANQFIRGLYILNEAENRMEEFKKYLKFIGYYNIENDFSSDKDILINNYIDFDGLVENFNNKKDCECYDEFIKYLEQNKEYYSRFDKEIDDKIYKFENMNNIIIRKKEFRFGGIKKNIFSLNNEILHSFIKKDIELEEAFDLYNIRNIYNILFYSGKDAIGNENLNNEIIKTELFDKFLRNEISFQEYIENYIPLFEKINSYDNYFYLDIKKNKHGYYVECVNFKNNSYGGSGKSNFFFPINWIYEYFIYEGKINNFLIDFLPKDMIRESGLSAYII